MPFVFKRLALLISIAAAFAADKEAPFRPAPAGTYPHRQSSERVTIAADPYDSGEKIKAAFGKLDPYQHGVLPVLIVIQNDSGQTLQLDRMELEYVGPNHNRVEATPAADVKYVGSSPHRPSAVPTTPGRAVVLRGKKSPLDVWEIEGRAFTAKMIPPDQTASGFFYFQTGIQRGATIYLNGLREAASGKELLYFEIPLD
jgi:hypothetical protein